MKIFLEWIAVFRRWFGSNEEVSLVLYRVENRVLLYRTMFHRRPSFLLMNVADYNAFINQVEDKENPAEPGETRVIPPLYVWNEIQIVVSNQIEEPHVVGDAVQMVTEEGC